MEREREQSLELRFDLSDVQMPDVVVPLEHWTAMVERDLGEEDGP